MTLCSGYRALISGVLTGRSREAIAHPKCLAVGKLSEKVLRVETFSCKDAKFGAEILIFDKFKKQN